jgi:hypothetical protein
MPDVILVPLERLDAALELLRAAKRLKSLTGGARINVLAVRTPPGLLMLGAVLSALAPRKARVAGYGICR